MIFSIQESQERGMEGREIQKSKTQSKENLICVCVSLQVVCRYVFIYFNLIDTIFKDRQFGKFTSILGGPVIVLKTQPGLK